MRQKTTRQAASEPSAPRFPLSALGGPGRRAGREAFTLVELLVVIAIIALLSSILLVAAQGALRTAARARIDAQLKQLNTAIEDYKNNKQSYPPNAQTGLAGERTPSRLDTAGALTRFQRHFNKAFPDHREPPQLLEALAGLSSTSTLTNGNSSGSLGRGQATNLEGGMNAAEALVFWLGGFSDDPKYPITGPGGPSYAVDGVVPANQADPIESRSWALDVSIAQLGPRDADNYFDTTDNRVIEYTDPRDGTTLRRIQFWYLKAGGSDAPYVYFDASRSSSPDQTDDVPAATKTSEFTEFNGPDEELLNELFDVHAIKTLKSQATDINQYQFANNKKFQILHPGIDDAWGVLPYVESVGSNPASAQLFDWDGDLLEILFPEGPWADDLLETLSNFADGRLEDSAP